MTPDKNKKPLPSSTSRFLPEQPKTTTQWKIALRRIKVLYLGGHWQQCSARCDQLLRNENATLDQLHATYIHFYSALSSEALARHTSDLSPAKIRTLTEAQVSYQAAAATLPLPSSIASLPSSCPSDHESAFTNTSSASEESAILDYYKFSTNPLIKHTPSPSSIATNSTIRRTNPPHPLSIFENRKSVSFTDAQTGNTLTLDQWPAPPATPPFTPPPRSTSLFPSTPHINTDPYVLSRAYERYNEHLYSFSEMLARHVQTIDVLIRATREAQAQARGRKGEDVMVGDLKARIRRLKEGGWRRERFCPGRYQDLCDVALGEL